ncbi:hypothetical protein JTE90_016332 [Oedothorax gibbosus]|uniref:Uncharacterized protein n=1 Tax=Oedothorax gibbosus TaxID=931172 RepID=A0AAV6TQ01_9ARAC|nr:hypothetical protein JTE90_016332 [Oedothorax gibbosus]
MATECLDYKALILQLLRQKKYPVLQGFVVIDIHYKLIPEDAPSQITHSFDQRVIQNPLHAWKTHITPHRIPYLVNHSPMFYMHETNQLDNITNLPYDCQRVKLSRGYVDAIRNVPSQTFEEEIYHFITLLNFDVPTLAFLLDRNIMTCTRLLPQFIRLWVNRYEERSMSVPVDTRLSACFGPSVERDIIPVRVLRGKLAPCTSSSTLLSLTMITKPSCMTPFRTYGITVPNTKPWYLWPTIRWKIPSLSNSILDRGDSGIFHYHLCQTHGIDANRRNSGTRALYLGTRVWVN